MALLDLQGLEPRDERGLVKKGGGDRQHSSRSKQCNSTVCIKKH